MPLRVLVIDRAPPIDLMQGNALIAANLFPRLRDVELTLVAPATGDRDAALAALGDTFRAVHLVPREAKLSALVGALEPVVARRTTRVPRPLDGRVDLAGTRALVHTIGRLLATEPWDAIHVRQLPMATYVPPSPVGRLLELIDAETLYARRSRRARARLRGLAATTLERRALRSADIVTVVSPIDAEALRELGTGVRVEVTTNGVDVERFDPVAVGPVREEPDTIAFVGAMSFQPNVDAAVWLVREVLPILRETRPTARVRLIGRDPVPAVVALAAADVEVTGTVDDVRPEILRSAVVAIPMVSGSGVKNKLLEAMSLARPIVSTTMGIESLDVVADRDLVVADGPAAFAAALDRLLGDPTARARLGPAARRYVVTGYSWEACARRYAELYGDLAAITRSRTAR